MKTLKQRVEQAAGISAATCAREGSPENNYNVILALKSTVYALVMELETVANWLDDDAEIPPGVRQSYRELAEVYREVHRAKVAIKSPAAEEAAQS